MTTAAPKRIQLRRSKGWRKPEGAVVVSRPTKWGNPFGYRQHTGLVRYQPATPDQVDYEGRISAHGMRHDYYAADGTITEFWVRYGTRAELVDFYRRALTETDTPGMRAAFPGGLGKWLGRWVNGKRVYITLEDVRRELAGKDLCCWCPLDKACHADVLLEIANAPVLTGPAEKEAP